MARAAAHPIAVKHPFFTIGHSSRSLTDFVDILEGAGVAFVVDVRTVPRSRTNPQYNHDVLPESLAAFGIGYDHIALLGGLRGRDRNVPADVNAFWQNTSFHNYADYAMGGDFRDGLDRLLEHGRRQRSAIMCAEAVWWRCHRRIIADYLLVAGEDVFHLMGPGRVQPASLTAAACVAGSGVLTYPPARPPDGIPHAPRGGE